MNSSAALTPETARLLSRLSFFLDEAEAALAQAEPERVVQSSGAWAQVFRELRQLPPAHWPSNEVRSALIGEMATRVAALQQAVVRAQARLGRGLDLLMGDGAGLSAQGLASTRPAPAPGYNAGGYHSAMSRTGGTYA
jgi:hypothetical protein